MIQDTMEFVNKALSRGEKVVLNTLVEKSSNAPGASGQMMAVLSDGTTKGTIGGGAVEFKVIERSKEAIANNEKVFSFEYDLSKEGMICGGKISGVGNVLGIGNTLVLFGAGHVSQAIAQAAKPLGFSIVVVDDRADLKANYNDVIYHATKISDLKDEIIFDENTYVVIATRGHAHDREALKYCLDKQANYLGMIGSKKKVAEIFNILQNEGVSIEQLKSVYAPVGLEIADGTPVEIAISILAEILLVKNNGKLISKRTNIVL